MTHGWWSIALKEQQKMQFGRRNSSNSLQQQFNLLFVDTSSPIPHILLIGFLLQVYTFIYKYSSLFPNPSSYICSFIFDAEPKAESLIEEPFLELK